MSDSTASAPLLAPDWPAISAVVVGMTAFSVSQGLTYPLISLILESRGVSESLIGLNATVFAIGIALATLALGWLGKVLNAAGMIIVGLIGNSVALILLWAFDSLWLWFLARFLLGFFTSLVFILSEAWLNVACPDRMRGRVSGVYGAGMCAGFAAGPLAIPLFGSESGLAFALLAVYVALVAFVVALLGRKARTNPVPSEPGGLRAFLRSGPVLVGLVAAFAFADVAAISIMPVYFVQVGHSEAFAALAVTMVALPTALTQPLVGMLLDRFSRVLVAVVSGVVAALTFMAIPLLHSELAVLTVFSVMGTASFSLYTCALTLLGERYRGAILMAGSAVFSLAYAAGSGAGSTFTGAAMDLFGPTAAPVSAGLVLLGFSLVVIVGRRV